MGIRDSCKDRQTLTSQSTPRRDPNPRDFGDDNSHGVPQQYYKVLYIIKGSMGNKGRVHENKPALV